MLFLLFAFSLSKKPIIIIPSHFGSRLYVNSTFQPFNSCPKSINNQHAWIRVRDLLSPNLPCLLKLLTVDIDEQKDEFKNQPNTTFSTLDFGGVSGILGIGPECFGRYLPVNYELIVNSFIDDGYNVHKDLLSAPYDWRFGLEQPDSYYENLKSLIVNAYKNNGNTKVTLLAHGLGATLTHLFLTDRTAPEWRKKYIDSATYIAPSWSGSGQALFATWRLKFPFIHLKFESLSNFVASLGAFHATLPNSVAYINNTLIVGPDRRYTGAEIIETIKQHGKLTKRQIKIADHNFKYSQELPKNPDFNVNIIFNSGVKTPMGFKLKSWDDVGAPIYGQGDSLYGSKVIEWACNSWGNNESRVRCHDALSDNKMFHHRYLLKNPEIITLLKKWIEDAKE